jgi:hypothetical protein
VIDDLFLLDEDYQDKRDELTDIISRLRKLHGMRVRLAHHIPQHQDGDTPAAEQVNGQTIPQRYAPMDANMIHDFIEQILNITDSLQHLSREISERRRSSVRQLIKSLRPTP